MKPPYCKLIDTTHLPASIVVYMMSIYAESDTFWTAATSNNCCIDDSVDHGDKIHKPMDFSCARKASAQSQASRRSSIRSRVFTPNNFLVDDDDIFENDGSNSSSSAQSSPVPKDKSTLQKNVGGPSKSPKDLGRMTKTREKEKTKAVNKSGSRGAVDFETINQNHNEKFVNNIADIGTLKGGSSASKLSKEQKIDSSNTKEFITAAENKNVDISYDKHNNKVSDVNTVMTALGIDAGVKDISPDPGTPNTEMFYGKGDKVGIVPEDSFYDTDFRGNDRDAKVIPDDINLQRTIDFKSSRNKTNNSCSIPETFAQNPKGNYESRRPPLSTIITDSDHKTHTHRPSSSSEKDYSTSSSSFDSILSLKKKGANLETTIELKEEDDCRGELAPESPRTPILEDDNRAHEIFGLNAKNMAHPGTLRLKEKSKRKDPVSQVLDQRDNPPDDINNVEVFSVNNLSVGDTADVSTSSIDNRADEIKREESAQHPPSEDKNDGRESDSGESEITERIGDDVESITSALKEDTFFHPDIIGRDGQGGMCYSPLLRSSSSQRLMRNRSIDSRKSSGQSFIQESIFSPIDTILEESESKTVLDHVESNQTNTQPEIEKSDNNEKVGTFTQITSVGGDHIKKKEAEIPLDYDFAQAQIEFDLQLDVKANSTFKEDVKTESTSNTQGETVISNAYSPCKRSLVVMGKDEEIDEITPLGYRDVLPGHSCDYGRSMFTEELSTSQENAPIDDIPIHDDLFKPWPQRIATENSRGDEIIPKISPYKYYSGTEKVEYKNESKSTNLVREGNGHFENKNDNCNIEAKDEIVSVVESVEDDFDRFDSTHLAMFQAQNHQVNGAANEADFRLVSPSHGALEYHQREPSYYQGDTFIADEDDGLKETPQSNASVPQPQKSTLNPETRKTLHVNRSISRSATDMSSMGRVLFSRTGRPKTTQALAKRGGEQSFLFPVDLSFGKLK